MEVAAAAAADAALDISLVSMLLPVGDWSSVCWMVSMVVGGSMMVVVVVVVSERMVEEEWRMSVRKAVVSISDNLRAVVENDGVDMEDGGANADSGVVNA